MGPAGERQTPSADMHSDGSVGCPPPCLPGEGRDPCPPCWSGRPPTASMCQDEVVAISNEGAVRGKAYPSWYGHLEASLPAAWCQRSGGGGASREAAAEADGGVFPAAGADGGGDRGLRWGAPLGP